MKEEMNTQYRRRHRDMFAHSALQGTMDQAPRRDETWRELVSMGVTFGLGLTGLAALVMVLTH